MEILNRKKIISIGVLVILLIGLIVGVILVQKQQIFKSRASLQIYNAFNVGSGEAGKYVNCTGNVCKTNTLNVTISVADLQALETTSEVISQTPEQTAREDYFQTVNDEPIVDDQSQNSALSAYFKSAQDVAESEDQEYARERGLPDAQTLGTTQNLISTLEKGLDVPDEMWQDWGSTLGNLSQGAVDLVASQVQEAQEKGEQAKAQEELAKAEVVAAQQQEKYTQALDRWSGMPALERAETLREYYNLPPSTDPEQVLSFYDKAMTLGGVEFRSGPQASTVGPYGVHLNTDLSSFIITDTKGSVSEYLSTATPDLVGIVQGAIETGQNLYELYQSMPPEKAVEVYFSLSPEARDKVNEAMLNGTKEIAGAAVQMVPFLGTNILSERVNGLNSNMAQIAEKLKDPNLTEEEREALKQEYFSSLNEVQDVKKDLVLNAAFDLVGGVPGSALAQKAAGKGSLAAKTLFVDTKTALQAAKQAGKEGLEGVWARGQRVATEERGNWDVFGLLRKGKGEVGKPVTPGNSDVSAVEKVKDVLSRIDEDQFRTSNGTLDLRAYKQDLSLRLSEVFDPEGVIPEVTDRLAYWVSDTRNSRELLLEQAELADRAYTFFRTKGIHGVTPETPQDIKGAIDALKYDSELFVREGRFRSKNPDEAKVEILQALVKQEVNMRGHFRIALEDVTETLDTLKDFSVKHGENPGSFSHIPQVIENRSRFHVVDEDVLFKVYNPKKESPGLSGLTIPEDGNILVGTWTGAQDLLHECIHGCDLAADTSRMARRALVEVMGSRSEADRVMEGFVTRVEEFGATLRGKASSSHSFGPEVNSAEQTIIQMAENLGVSLDKARAKAIALTVQGRFDEIVKIAGVEKVKSILKENPTNIPGRFPTNEAIVTPLERNLAISEALEDLARAKEVRPQDNSGLVPFWNLLIGEVFAQGENSDNFLPNSSSLEHLVKLKLAKRRLETTGYLDNHYIGDLMKINIFAPETTEIADGLSMITGKAGNVESEIEAGKYKVEIGEMADLDIKIPAFVEIKSGVTLVPIAIREGSGKVEKTAGLSRGIGGGETAKVKVAAFYDENGNGRWDSGEKALPWAGIQVTLSKVTQEKTIYLKEGWNLISLPVLPSQVMTAKDLLGQIAKQGGSATAVSTLENGSWKSYVVKDHQDYSSDNFPIEPGKAYFVNASKRSIFSFTGQEFASPVKLFLKQGWNAVGFPILSRQFKARDLGAKEEFTIEENKSYLLKIEKEIDFNP